MGKGTTLDPWHLWGSTQMLVHTSQDPGRTPVQQLLNVDAKYPIAWAFFLSATVSWLPPNPGTMGVQINYYLQMGVGRSNVRIAPWHQFIFTDAELTASNGEAITKWTSQIVPPVPGFPPPAGNAPQPQDRIVAQTIQMQADMLITGIAGINTVQLAEVVGYVAPLAHVRPEWFAGNFGSEMGGS